MERSELYAAITSDLEQRSRWETRQGLLYDARYRGLRRTNLPWPNASDINWPLVDGIVDKLKPYYLQQLFATELLASFQPTVGGDGVTAQTATSAAQWFDFQLKQESNLEEEVVYVIDYLLMLGRPALKVLWNATAEKVEFHAVEPSRLIVPPATKRLWQADRIVHVLTFSPDEYRRQPGYKTDAAFMKRITGKGDGSDTHGQGAIRSNKYSRQGITEGREDEIIVWETWRQVEAGKFEVETFSPLSPAETVKPTIGNPYDHKNPPFADFPYELTQPDWYAPRGIAEIILPFQAELTKLLNEKNDAMTLANRPMFMSDRDIPNPANLRWRPGQILPQGVRPAPMPPPPIAFDQHIILMRDVAEKLVATPDYGMSSMTDLKKARTATEMEQIASMNQQSSDLRMRVFRMALGRAYQLAWQLLRQYASNRLQFWLDDVMMEVPPDVIRRDYRIRPSGSADGVTRQTMWRRAVGRMQMFANDPFIDQGELRKSVLEADDAGLVKRLYRDPQVFIATQAEEQATEIAVMKLGHPAAVTAVDDHATHIRTVLQYVQQQVGAKMPPSPLELGLLQQHMMQHVAALQKQDPAMAKQAMDAIMVIGQAVMGQGQNEPTPEPTE